MEPNKLVLAGAFLTGAMLFSACQKHDLRSTELSASRTIEDSRYGGGNGKPQQQKRQAITSLFLLFGQRVLLYH